MEELSIFVDESGDAGETSTYYLITIVLHDQARDINQVLVPYEADLRARRVADIPMHLGPLLNGVKSKSVCKFATASSAG